MRWAKSVNGTRRGKGESSALVKVFQVQKTSNRQPDREGATDPPLKRRAERNDERSRAKLNEANKRIRPGKLNSPGWIEVVEHTKAWDPETANVSRSVHL